MLCYYVFCVSVLGICLVLPVLLRLRRFSLRKTIDTEP